MEEGCRNGHHAHWELVSHGWQCDLEQALLCVDWRAAPAVAAQVFEHLLVRLLHLGICMRSLCFSRNCLHIHYQVCLCHSWYYGVCEHLFTRNCSHWCRVDIRHFGHLVHLCDFLRGSLLDLNGDLNTVHCNWCGYFRFPVVGFRGLHRGSFQHLGSGPAPPCQCSQHAQDSQSTPQEAAKDTADSASFRLYHLHRSCAAPSTMSCAKAWSFTGWISWTDHAEANARCRFSAEQTYGSSQQKA
mmetsp:Transcript_4133/g.9965  ORF Transcript_4133/g.9965 Transcript_4133/m.9965 type:complete len:243 (-) Transcript_4133:91-819(-)|eukprot:CAMPEP_0181432800 /NCGR_PEP_ID=MMETSP1110-20121109/18958_1 /TAXON_ID=174948 /ORGANISM="Symbiodinium sp., Strain CCMP421" /LENGTH=242 /DNA_ID=CAMNT_0023556223 /DNA_START=450 /DNA_END=1178 /DNA_ORIENTATION=+